MTPPTAPPTIAPVFPALASIVVVIVSFVPTISSVFPVIVSFVCWGEFVDVVGVVSDVVGSVVGGLSVVAIAAILCACV